MEISNYHYNGTACAVLDLLKNLGRYESLGGGIMTDVTYLTPEQCYHLYKFLEPYASDFKTYKPLLEELKHATRPCE